MESCGLNNYSDANTCRLETNGKIIKNLDEKIFNFWLNWTIHSLSWCSNVKFFQFISCKESKTKNSSVKNSPKKKKTGLREIGIEIQFFARDAV